MNQPQHFYRGSRRDRYGGVDERELVRDMLLAQSRALLCSPPNAGLTPPDRRGVTDSAVLEHSCTAAPTLPLPHPEGRVGTPPFRGALWGVVCVKNLPRCSHDDDLSRAQVAPH